MVEDVEPGADSDLRRRAAWFLAVLAVVAALFAIVMTTVIGGSGGNNSGNNAPGPLDSAATGAPTVTTSARPTPTTSAAPTSSALSSGALPSTTAGSGSCPTTAVCVLPGDLGNGVAAIDAYRTAHGRPSVPGAVSPEAQACAMQNGNGCSGGWAETEVPQPDGAAAVRQILPFAKLLDPNLKSIQVGWAYDPKAKLYYFAIIRID